MASSPVETIKEKLELVEFLRGYLALQPAGKNFKALCPFHREKTPSFMVSPERQTWHCFGCGAGGDLFTFLMRYENIEFSEALKILAEKAGVELRRLNPAEYKYIGLLYDINEAAKEFFRRELESSEPAKKYLAERGLKKETIEEFELGWAPNSPETLTLELINAGFHPDDILRAGLSFKTERGLQLDRFRGRIMFPIHNHFGKTVGFTGRVLPQFDDGKSGKYVNSPETPIFSKSKLLYGFWKSKNFIREAGSAFLVEGQMDFLLSWQLGLKQVVASSGTALTHDHLKVLRRLTEQLIVSFDSDEAGWEAGERAIDLAETNDFSVKVVTFKDYKDPAELALAEPEHLRQAVAQAQPAPEFYFQKYLSGRKFDPREREFLKRLRLVLAKIKNISSPIARSFWFKELAQRTGLNEKNLVEEAEKLGSVAKPASASENEEQIATPKKFSRWEILSHRYLAILLSKIDFSDSDGYSSYLVPVCQEIFRIFQKDERKSEVPELDELINLIVLQAREIAPQEFEELKIQLHREYLKERRRELIDLVRQAEIKGDEQALNAILREFNQLPAF